MLGGPCSDLCHSHTYPVVSDVPGEEAGARVALVLAEGGAVHSVDGAHLLAPGRGLAQEQTVVHALPGHGVGAQGQHQYQHRECQSEALHEAADRVEAAIAREYVVAPHWASEGDLRPASVQCLGLL